MSHRTDNVRYVRGGVIVASVTFFLKKKKKSGPLVVSPLKLFRHLLLLARNGADGAVLFGKTGGGDQVSLDQQLKIHAFIGQMKAAGKFPKNFQISVASLFEDYESAQQIVWSACKWKFEGVLVMPPKDKSNTQPGDQATVFKFMSGLCIASDGDTEHSPDIIAYNFPDEPCKRGITPEALSQLMHFDAMCAVKDSSNQLYYAGWLHVRSNAPRYLMILNGNDMHFREALAAGCDGCITGSGNNIVFLRLLVEMWRAHCLIRTNQELVRKDIQEVLQSGSPFAEAIMQHGI
jgi:dihydrodipicolinate synthase/N-acetylneuraminate lyase